jgi:hypothetical protein
VPRRSKGKGYQALGALGSLLLHALLLAFAATRHARPAPPARDAASPAQFEIEVLEAASVADEQSADVDVDVDDGRARARTAASRPSPAASGAVVSENDGGTGEHAEASDSAGEDEPEETATSSPSAAPRLGLAELGLTGPNPFLDRSPSAPARTKKRVNVKKRLDQALAQGLQNQSTALGLGAGSPVMRSLEAAVYASSVPLNGNALFTFVIDSEGTLVSSSLGDVSSDRDKWERVARQAAQALAQRKLVVPKGRSVKLTVAVSSHLELPSGADPGLEVRALGIPLKKGGGPRSTRIDLLNPLTPMAPLSLAGDPADIGAKPRRMVHSHVVSEELL